MSLSLVTAPASEPITTAVAKLHLRVDSSTDDALIDTLCAAAREYVETGTRRKCITQTWDLKLNCFPGWDQALHLPFPPVSSVTSITYIAPDGTSTVWSSALYTTDLAAGPKAQMARIVPVYGQSWPQTRGVINAVVVRFVCGYANAAAVPGGMLAAMKLLIGHWYANRESVVVGSTPAEVQQGVESLIWQYKAW
jgi:uncharacterized phiE125 gp8 family phage protein